MEGRRREQDACLGATALLNRSSLARGAKPVGFGTRRHKILNFLSKCPGKSAERPQAKTCVRRRLRPETGAGELGLRRSFHRSDTMICEGRIKNRRPIRHPGAEQAKTNRFFGE